MRHYLTSLAFASCWLLMVCAAAAQEKAEVRTWRDAAGKYSVEASLVNKTATTVRLMKTDGKIVTVPIERLSEADREYLKGKSDDPFAGGDPAPSSPSSSATGGDPDAPPVTAVPTEPMELPIDGTPILLALSTPPSELAPDPAPETPQLGVGTSLVTTTDAYDKVVGPIFVDAASALCAVSVGRNVAGRPEETHGQLFLGTLPRGRFRPIYDSKESIRLLDHDPISDATLMLTNMDVLDRGGEIIVVTGVSAGTPREISRFLLPGHEKPGFKPGVTTAKIVGGNSLFAIIDDVIYCWHLNSKKLIYRSDPITGLKEPAFSGGRKYAAIGTNKGFHLMDTRTGEDLGFVSSDTVLAPGLAFHPDGQRLAWCCSNQWGVWDVAKNQMLGTGIVTEHLGGRVIGWVGDDWFLTDLGYVLDSQSQMIVWNYYVGAVASQQQVGKTMVIASKLNGLKIESLPVPDPKALVASKKLASAGPKMMLTAPGTKVRLRVEASEQVNEEELLAGLKTAVERAGWVVDAKAPLEVVAKIGRAKAYDLQFTQRAIGQPLGQGTKQTVSITPFTAELIISDGKQVLWTRNTENRVPPTLFLRNGQTLEEAVKGFERPQPEFFAGLQIPPRIPKKEFASGLGRSRLDKGVWVDF